MEQKRQLITDMLMGVWPVTELCQRYGISRQTAYKWLRRFRQDGGTGLQEQSRRPHTSPGRTPDEVEARFVAVHKKHPTWGAGKVLDWLHRNEPGLRDRLPARSTAHEIFLRHGLVKQRRRRTGQPPTRPPTTVPLQPNDVWTIDFKGEFKTRDGIWLYPLTVADDFSRYVLGCRGLPSVAGIGVKPVLERIFREYGLPRVILSDNGAPFGTTGLSRLSMLSVWWIHLGIRIERIQPGRPTQNPRHERMHRTLKQDCTRPPAANARAQQGRFNGWRGTFNDERPHEALGGLPPIDVYEPSNRLYPSQLPELEYPGYYERRKVSGHGYISLKGDIFFLSRTLAAEWVGLCEVDDDIWSVSLGPVELGRYDAHAKTFHPGGAQAPRETNRITRDEN